ncbi:MAG: rRNA pseudouridine synthase [Peptococcaceae bacterium]|nr:rRNA pseudouridine synthase [Peptococcaceae bacterium]
MERLHKYIARCGAASRRKAESLIAMGQVRVNGRTVTEMGVQIDPGQDRVELRDQILTPVREKLYYAFHKPKGVLTALSDSRGRPDLSRYIPGGLGLFPVGRLDLMSEGLLLLTNDGELANRLIHPRYKVEKKYIVTAGGTVNAHKLRQLRQGVVLEDGSRTLPAGVRKLSAAEGGAVLEFILREGKKRQIRRMCLAADLSVLELKRVAIGPVQLSDLPAGALRKLTEEEIRALKDGRQNAAPTNAAYTVP